MSTHESLSKYSCPRQEGRGSGLGAVLGGGRDEVWFLSAGRSVNRSRGRIGQEAETSTILLPPIFLKPQRIRYPTREKTQQNQSCQEEYKQECRSSTYGATSYRNETVSDDTVAKIDYFPGRLWAAASGFVRCRYGDFRH